VAQKQIPGLGCRIFEVSRSHTQTEMSGRTSLNKL